MNRPLIVSIITVCFNSAKTIEQTIHSVLNQQYPHIEYIVIDGGSTDGTLEIIKRYREKIALLISEPDGGMYDAMNKGISLASGDIIGLLHSNDLFATSHVVSTIAECFNDSAIDICHGDLIYFSALPEKIYRYWRSCDFSPGLFAKGWSPAHPTFYVRRSVYLQHGAFNTEYSMGNDVELMMRFLEKYHLRSHYIPEILVRMRLGGASNRFKNIWLQNKNILKAARQLGIPISTREFIGGKILNRLSQWLLRPRRETNYAR